MLTNLIFLLLENFTNSDRTPPYISDKNEPNTFLNLLSKKKKSFLVLEKAASGVSSQGVCAIIPCDTCPISNHECCCRPEIHHDRGSGILQTLTRLEQTTYWADGTWYVLPGHHAQEHHYFLKVVFPAQKREYLIAVFVSSLRIVARRRDRESYSTRQMIRISSYFAWGSRLIFSAISAEMLASSIPISRKGCMQGRQILLKIK